MLLNITRCGCVEFDHNLRSLYLPSLATFYAFALSVIPFPNLDRFDCEIPLLHANSASSSSKITRRIHQNRHVARHRLRFSTVGSRSFGCIFLPSVRNGVAVGTNQPKINDVGQTILGARTRSAGCPRLRMRGVWSEFAAMLSHKDISKSIINSGLILTDPICLQISLFPLYFLRHAHTDIPNIERIRIQFTCVSFNIFYPFVINRAGRKLATKILFSNKLHLVT